jgi:ketosteroid isomerase-like protein
MTVARPAWILAAAWLPAAAAAAVPAAAADCAALEPLRWLLGDWQAEGSKTRFHESWRERDRQTFSGTGIERAKPDGAVKGAEDLRLVQMGDGVFYVSKVTHNELPVAFRLTTCADGVFVFENPAHDFPRRLEYRRGDDALTVRVSDGAEQGFTLEFQRAAGPAVPAVLADEDARFAAMVAGDAAAMGSWFAEDLHYVHATGLVEDRAQLIDSIASGRARYVAVTPAEREVVGLADDAALVRGRGRFQVAANGVPLDLQIRYLAVYGLQDGRWRLRSWQSLRVP